MTENRDQELVECLRRMIEELGSPGLTLAQSDALRPRINGLLESLRGAPNRPCPDFRNACQ